MAQQVWKYETLDSLQRSATGTPLRGPGYMTEKQALRMERIRQARQLFRGEHRRYYLEESRTQFDYPVQMVNGTIVRPYWTLNLLKLVAKKVADLLFGESPLVRVDDEIQQQKLTDLVERTSLHRLCMTAAQECVYEGETFLESVIYNGHVYIRRVIADRIHPEGELQPDGQYASYVAYREDRLGDEVSAPKCVLITRWLAGAIERELWQIDRDGNRVKRLTLDNWPAYRAAGATPPDREPTGIAANTITWIPGDLDHDEPVSDFDGLVDPQDVVNAKWTQINRVLQQNTDPKLALPMSLRPVDGSDLPPDQRLFFFQNKDQVPQYITYQAQLEAALREKATAVQHLLILSEMSPALLGLKEGQAPDAWRKLRLEATSSLAMAKRKGVWWAPGIRRALSVAQELEQILPGNRYDRYAISAELRDGIPQDEVDQATVISTYRSAGVMSVERAVEIQLPEDAARAKELERLAEEKRRSTPTILLGNEDAMGAGNGAGDGAAQDMEQQMQGAK